MIEKVTGFIVSTTNFGETSLILHIFTKEYGLIGVMAKGVKSLKSKLRAYTMRFTYGHFYLHYKKEKLSILNDVDIIDTLTTIHQDITLISYVNYITDLSTQVYKETQNELIFEYMIEAILKMNEGFDAECLTNILEIKYLPFLGVGIYLDGCVSCGSKKSIVTIDGDQGGFLCKNCYNNEKLVKPKSIQLLRLYSQIDLKQITKLNIPKENKKEINNFLTAYYNRYTGIYTHSKDFLNKLNHLD